MIRLPPALQALVRTTPTTAPIANRSLISVTGSQATQWLSGILASSVPNPPKGHFYSVFLNAQGRVLYDVFVYAQPNSQGYFIEHDSRSPSEDLPSLLRVLKQFVLRAKVKIRDVSEEYDVWAAWGSERETRWETERCWNLAERSNIAEPLWDSTTQAVSPWGNEDLVLQDRRGVGMGHRLLVKRGEKPQEASTHDIGSGDDYGILRFINGVPEGVVELQPMQAFPMESNLDLMGAIDFRKGCYVGQELTVRTYHTGVIRKRIFPVAIHPLNQTLEEAAGLDQTTALPDPTIRPVVYEHLSGTPVRKPRGNSKLLNSINGVGLALLRCDHVEAVDDGVVQLAIGEGADERRVTHWYPHWWPTPHSRITRSP